MLGIDEAATFTQENLANQGISVHAFIDETRPTTRKERYRAHGKTLLRVNHLRQHNISLSLVKDMTRQIDEHLADTDLVLFSDFNYGCLPQGFVDAVIERAASRGVMMAADSQASSQMSDISRFKRMRLITPTERAPAGRSTRRRNGHSCSRRPATPATTSSSISSENYFE